MASITFTDATGTATLNSAWPSPANRFRGWTPFEVPFGDAAHGLGTGRRYLYEYRRDYGATFELPGIANTDLDIAMRLKAHLEGGGLVTLTTNDASSTVYTNIGIAPDTEVEIVFEDRAMLEYTVKLTVLDQDTVPAQLLCEY
jgi:voltage-gated potassium channel Kch